MELFKGHSSNGKKFNVARRRNTKELKDVSKEETKNREGR